MFFVLSDQFASIQQREHVSGHFHLAGLRADLMNLWQEGLPASVKDVEGKRAYDIGNTEKALGMKGTPDAVSAHELSSIQQREALFGAEVDRPPIEFPVYFFCGVNTAFEGNRS